MTNPNDPVTPSEQQAVLIKKQLGEKYPELDGDIITIAHKLAGLTKREYFAALAMQGMIPNYRPERSAEGDRSLAFLAIQLADALIAELNKADK